MLDALQYNQEAINRSKMIKTSPILEISQDMNALNEGTPEQIILRFNNQQLAETLEGETKYISRLRFFMQYPPKVRQQLISIGILEASTWNEAGKVIYSQGGHSDYYFVIIKGTVSI